MLQKLLYYQMAMPRIYTFTSALIVQSHNDRGLPDPALIAEKLGITSNIKLLALTVRPL